MRISKNAVLPGFVKVYTKLTAYNLGGASIHRDWNTGRADITAGLKWLSSFCKALLVKISSYSSRL
jgi:hypothetical protein